MLELNRFKYNSAKKQKTEKKYKKGIDKEGKEWYNRKAADWAELGHWKLNNNKIRQEVYEKELLSNPKRTRERKRDSDESS